MSNAIQRTFFYALPAFGLYSSQVECLRSYIERLALAHHWMPRDLIQLLLKWAPLGALTGSPLNISDNWAIHSDSPVNSGLLRRLSDATQQSLEGTSMARFGHAFSMFDLLDRRGSERVRFCPLCFEEDLKNGHDYPYGRLLWVIKAVTCCPEHGCHLQESTGCSTNGVRRLALQQRPRAMGICPDCGSIGRRCAHSAISMATPQELSIAKVLGQVLTLSDSECSACSDECVRVGVREAIKHSFNGQYIPAARAAGLGRGTIHSWLQLSSRPGLASLAQLAIACNVDLSWMLRGEVRPIAAHVDAADLKQNFRRSYRRSEVSDAEVAQVLADALAQKVVPSLASLARKTGIRIERLSRKFPLQARAVVNAHRQHVAQRREQVYTEAVHAFSAAALKLQDQGDVITSKRLQEAAGTYVLGRGNPLRSRALHEVLQSANFPAY